MAESKTPVAEPIQGSAMAPAEDPVALAAETAAAAAASGAPAGEASDLAAVPAAPAAQPAPAAAILVPGAQPPVVVPPTQPAAKDAGRGKKGKGGGPTTPKGGTPATNTAALLVGGPPVPGTEVSQSPKQPLDQKHERLAGTVVRFTPQNGWGYVRSSAFEGELFFRIDRMMPEFQGHPLQEGENVEFDVQSDDHGRAHAIMLKPLLGRTPYECLGQRHRGYVRRFAERWGFLNAAAFDGDLFVHRDNLLPVPEMLSPDGQPPLRAGQAVEFDVALDDRGRAVAKQITTRALLRPCDWTGQRLRGYIRSFQGAWGFINSDRFAGDLFIHRDSLQNSHQGATLSVGTVVEFDVERDHHRKNAKNRLVARNVSVLPQEEAPIQAQATAYATMPPQQPIPGMPPQQPLQPLDPSLYSTLPPQALPAGYGGHLNPQAASFAPSAAPPMYYSQGAQAAGLPPELLGQGYIPPNYPYPQSPYMQQPVLPPQQPLPPLQQPYPQQPYAQSPYAQPPYAQQPYGIQPQQPVPQPQMPLGQVPQPQPTYGALPGQVPPQQQLMPAQAPDGEQMPPPPVGQQPAPEAAPAQAAPPTAGGEGAVPVAEAGQAGAAGGLLHITMHDWEPDQPGQLFVTKGTLVNVSYRAAHGWVYAGMVQPGQESSEPASEGWIPQAVVKRVSLCRVAIDWPAEGSGTLGVGKGEIIAVSKEAERGWVYGERIGPRQPDRLLDGWLPKKVLEYLHP
eukprot:gnl/TRDRNA2_/TRDRNA2_91031_c0_seq1.p1 gnl/TRDRNA2_/TRDRNA2_91031_c0~~gnl/TRDRNA2_/TRDRNA2_91031_c0_seq1.p1  ORF type:complete len:734 (+),score=151.10 gnl/TRDRNA2_/TRDRNA2_91031_c0_seq1:119-2320(+)